MTAVIVFFVMFLIMTKICIDSDKDVEKRQDKIFRLEHEKKCILHVASTDYVNLKQDLYQLELDYLDLAMRTK